MASKKKGSRANATGRNETERFIMLTRNIYSHHAWLALSNVSVRIYLEIRRRYNGANNGEISLSYREASAVAHCSPATAGRALAELGLHGFIRESTKGIYTVRKASTWILTSEKIGENPPTKDWYQWQPKTKHSDSGETNCIPGETDRRK